MLEYRFRYFLFAVAFLLISTSILHAQDKRFQFDPNISYDSEISSPAEFLGYELGSEFSFHSDVVDYLKYLAEESDRIRLKKYAETYEGRGLYFAVISSEGNQSNIDQLRNNNLQLTDPGNLEDNTAESIKGDQPVTVWLSYNVHGNEPSSSEAAMQTAYRLVAGMDAETKKMRSDAITIIDPMLNPDGRDRYVYWYKSSRSALLNSNADDLEHDEIWPGGRTNHYWFDLNRDWVWLVHPESRGRIETYQKWMPQVHLDLHEQGFNSNYFTMPGTTPRNHELPENYEKWADVFGRGVIAEFDDHNINYATREAFDFFYPGYGSSYPSNMGAIGMLAEQGGHSRGGRSVETKDGYKLTLRQRVFDHYTNSIATVRTSIENRKPLLDYFQNAFSEEAKKGDVEAFIIPNNDRSYTGELINIMLQHGVEIGQATENFEVDDAYSYWDGEAESRQFKKGSYIISTDQPRHIFLNTLMKRQLAIGDSVMYDMATWAAPMAYNLDAAWSNDDVKVETTPVTEVSTYDHGVKNSGAGYAYVVDGKQRYAPNALAKFWDAGYRVRVAKKYFTYDGKRYSRGSLVILLGRNYEKRDTIASDMERIAKEAKVTIEGFDTGRMVSGMDLASNDSEPVDRPNVALMVDSPFSSYTAGQIWFLFDQWTEFGINRIRSDRLSYLDLQEYDVLVLPGAWGGLSSTLDSTALDKLKGWVKDGGTLVATESAAEFMSKGKSGFTSVELADEPSKGDKEEDTIKPAAYTTYAAREDSSGLKRIPGSAFQGHIDNTNPLAFGMPNKLFSLKFSDESLVPSTDWQVVGHYSKDSQSVLASGYASPENKKQVAGNAFAGVQRMGSGQVVFLLDNTQYRMFWVGPARMMQNAVMLLHDM
ncbi:Zinc carboxypeptidase [Fodinibius salinus]|uniref:Zinc carboxypeptidase n=1 Tax=Fodinibius salinus TaxID=860790 RepID=A0A5D3YMW9_9BACT|nr:M14 family metallopeptidase [Fodinibius salinus]TYP95525.1 Zinc carboxypeptidase [Fodinibius salinus]